MVKQYLLITLISITSMARSAQIEPDNINAVDADGRTPLFIAARDGHTEQVQELLQAGAIVDLPKTSDGATSLYIAAERGHLGIVKLLTDHRATVDAACTDDNATPLFIATQQGHCDIVKWLIHCNASVHTTRHDGSTALHIAIQQRHFDITELLIKQGALVNHATFDGTTPLLIAILAKNPPLVRLLLTSGAKDFSFFDASSDCMLNAYSTAKKLLKQATNSDDQAALQTIMELLAEFRLHLRGRQMRISDEDNTDLMTPFLEMSTYPPAMKVKYEHESFPPKTFNQ